MSQLGGDDGQAIVTTPYGVTVDGSGVPYIADSGNCRVSAASNGVIATVAGTGPATAAGGGVGAIDRSCSSHVESNCLDVGGCDSFRRGRTEDGLEPAAWSFSVVGVSLSV